MKQLITSMVFVFIVSAAFAQQGSPVTFGYDVKKISEKVYQVTITATIARPWHIYSQYTAADGPSQPTRIKFAKNPLVEIAGKPAEKGTLITKHDEVLDMDLKFFADKVEFVQEVELKAPVKTILNGSIRYMVCTDTQCLLPTTINFNLSLN